MILKHATMAAPPLLLLLLAVQANTTTLMKNYRLEELKCLYESVTFVLPISSAEWEMVCHSHEVYYPGHTQEVLYKKFNDNARKNVPTGDLTCPP